MANHLPQSTLVCIYILGSNPQHLTSEIGREFVTLCDSDSHILAKVI